MIVYDHVTQPRGKSNLDLISQVLQAGSISRIDVAAAYVTLGGARDLLSALADCLGAQWPTVRKRWLVSFDYCRTEPIAARMLSDIPASAVRVHDGASLVLRKCIPTRPFHPKTFIFRGEKRIAVFAGSGNVSRSGLNTGHEVGLLLDCRSPVTARDSDARAQIGSIQNWYEATWNAADALTPALVTSYESVFNSVENLSNLVPTDDDPIPPPQGRNSLSSEDLRKLRVCTNFWIQAGNVTKNLGKNRPGNQLMMKRLSRVFFGVPATNVPQNSPLRRVRIVYDQAAKDDCSLTFSDNGMDKLTLPIPGDGGPDTYDGQALLFERTGPSSFVLRLGTPKEARQWIARSKAISAHFVMPPDGRQWGVF
jgi:HKD family nuclease